MKLKFFFNHSSISLACLLACITIFIISCNKDNEGFYKYENQESVFDGDTYSYLQSKLGVYDSLFKALDRVPWVKDTLQSDSITLFALTNNSFKSALQNLNLLRASQGRSALDLNTVDVTELDTLLSKYIIKGRYTTDSLLYTDGASLKSVKYHFSMHGQRVKSDALGYVGGGPTSIYYSDTKESNFVKDWSRAQTQAVNIITLNGVLHILSNSHEFGFGEFSTRMNKNK